MKEKHIKKNGKQIIKNGSDAYYKNESEHIKPLTF